MPIVKLTASNVPTLQPKAGKRTDYTDALCPGLVLRVTPAGARTFAVAARQGSRVRRVTIGPTSRVKLAAAREHARRIMAQLEAGHEPPPAPEAHVLTVGSLVDRCLEDLQLRASTRAAWEQLRDAEVATLADLPAAALRRANVRDWLRTIRQRSGWTANHALELLRRAYSWGMAEDLLEHSPCAGLAKPHKATASDRVLSPAELWALRRALPRARAHRAYADATALLLLTGARRGEVLGMRRGEVQGTTWVIPAGRDKTGREHAVPLSPAAQAIIRRRLEAVPTEHLFPRCDGKGRAGQYREEPATWPSSWTAWLRRRVARTLAALARARHEQARPVPRWRVHDLRHTLRTHAREHLRVPDDVAELLLGHVRPGILGVYNRATLLDERRAALDSWATWLESVAPDVAPERGRLRLVASK